MIFPLALLLALCSGTAALAHELLWTRRCIDLLGASAASSARVFGCFFLGLAIGAAAATRLTPRLRRPWRALAWIELSVALLALPALLLPMWTDWIWRAIGPERLASGLGAQLKLGLSFGMIFPPAFAMGLFLPVMATAVLGASRPLSRHGIWLYSAKTLGGVLGLWLVMGLTLHHLGAIGSMLTAMGINLLVAITCGVIDRFQPPLPSPQLPTTATQPKVRSQPVDGVTLALAVVSGAGIIAAEIIALDAIQLVATMSFYAPAVVLTTVLGVLAFSALIVPRIADRSVASAMVWCLIGAGLALALSPLLFMRIAQYWNPFASPLSVPAFGLALVGLTMMLLGPGLFMAAFVFPLLMRRRGRAGDERGRGLGWLLACNGLGGFLGAEIAYRLILPNFGPHQGMGWVGLL